jgi:hypothetical protein
MFQNFSKIWIIVVIAVFAVAGVFCWQYFDTQKENEILNEEITELEQSEEQIEEREVLVKNEIADWKTYRNEEYGFEIKYPSDEDFIIFSPEYESILFNGRTTSWELRLRIWNNPKKLSLAEYLINVHYLTEYDPSRKEKIPSMLEKKKIGNIEYFEGIWGYPAKFILIDQYIFEFLSNHYDEEFNQMFSSFRFLE